MEKLFELKQQRAEMVTKMRAMMDKFEGAETVSYTHLTLPTN